MGWIGCALGRLVLHDVAVADFRKLLVWHKAYAMALSAERAAKLIHGYEYSSLRSQLLRAAMSVPANIVEGREHSSDREFRRYLHYSLASVSEFENHLTAARDMELLPEDVFKSLLDDLVEVRKMLHGLITRIGKSL